MSRTESTEAFLYGGTDAKIWVAPKKMLYFEKQNVKFTVKIVEFDYDTADDYAMMVDVLAITQPICLRQV